jgi:tetratricopeptide (TPR) repeat protein
MNPLSDRWALGVSLYEMVTGRVPFGAGKCIEEIETEIRNRPRMPDLDVPDAPAALHTVLFKLLDPAPERRYQSAKELLLDLRNYPEMPKVAGYQGETVRSEMSPPGAVTRRSTVPPRPAQPAPPPRRTARQAQRELLIRTAVIIGAILFTVWLLVRESRAVAEARKLAADLSVERISVTDARERFDELRKRRLTWIPTRDIERLLSSGLTNRGDSIVTRFRTAGVKIAEWKQARSYFEQALESNPRDDAIRGRLRICDAHLARYQGQAEKNPDAFESAERLFREASRLLRDSPDPWLGIAMLEIYNRKEPEAGETALNEARNRSFDFTTEERWVGLLAETYRTRADSLEWEALRIARTLPAEAEERLERAASYHQKAIDWYSRAPLYGDALQEIERCRESRDRIESRIEQLRSSGDGQQ